MPDYFVPVAAPPRGLVVPAPTDALGVSGPTAGRARGPGFRRTTPGRYVPAETPRSPEQRILEQAQRLPPGGAVGDWASLLLHGAAYFDGRDGHGRELPVPLVLPPGRTLHPFAGGRAVRLRRPYEVVVRHGIPCLDPYAALVREVAGARDLHAAVVVVDMALAAGVVELDRLRDLPLDDLVRNGRWQVASAIDRADARSLSPRESWFRMVWTDVAGLPRPRCNWMVLDGEGRHVATPDLLDPHLGVAGDYDGSAHREPHRHRRDEHRREAMTGLGLEHVTVVGQGPGDEEQVARRLRAAADRARYSLRPRLWVAREGRPPAW